MPYEQVAFSFVMSKQIWNQVLTLLFASQRPHGRGRDAESRIRWFRRKGRWFAKLGTVGLALGSRKNGICLFHLIYARTSHAHDKKKEIEQLYTQLCTRSTTQNRLILTN